MLDTYWLFWNPPWVYKNRVFVENCYWYMTLCFTLDSLSLCIAECLKTNVNIYTRNMSESCSIICYQLTIRVVRSRFDSDFYFGVSETGLYIFVLSLSLLCTTTLWDSRTIHKFLINILSFSFGASVFPPVVLLKIDVLPSLVVLPYCYNLGGVGLWIAFEPIIKTDRHIRF